MVERRALEEQRFGVSPAATESLQTIPAHHVGYVLHQLFLANIDDLPQKTRVLSYRWERLP
jgi:hypothetical protein